MILIVALKLLLYSLVALGDNRKYVGSEDCVIAQFCNPHNAVRELQAVFGMTEEDASTYVSNRTIEHSCSCHESCEYLGLCCQDVTRSVPEELTKTAERLRTDPDSYMCKTMLGKDTIIVNSCPEDSPLVMRKHCVEGEDVELLVTSSTSMLTYKNFYCGLCNGEYFENLIGWSWNFDCLKHWRQLGVSNRTAVTLLEKAKKNYCSLNRTVPMIPPNNTEVHHSIGVYLDGMDLCGSPPISSCPAGANQIEVDNCKTSPISLAIFEGKVYRNQHCLSCNQGSSSLDSAICEACENEGCNHPSIMIHNRPLLGSFGVLVQPYDDSKILECKTEDEQDCNGLLDSLTTCGHGQYLDYRTSTCKDTCPEGYHLKDGRCEFLGLDSTCQNTVDTSAFQQIALAADKYNHLLHGKTFIAFNRSATTLCYTCEHLTSVSADTAHFQIGEKGDIWYMSTMISQNFIYRVDTVSSFVCLDAVISTDPRQPDYRTEELVTYPLLSISILSLVLYFIAYLMFKRLRNVPGKIIAGNMLCLFLAYMFFLIRSVPGINHTSACAILAVFVNYFFLASFVFNIIYAGFIVRSLEFIDLESRVNELTVMKLWLVGFLTPFLVIIPALVLDQVTESEYRPQYGGRTCFITNRYGMLLYFIAPIGLSLFIAILLYLAILIKLIVIAKQTDQVRTNHSEKVAIAIKLLVVLGFNWIFAIIASVSSHRALTLVFIVTCTLQGFFGFVVFICNKAMLKDIRKCLRKGTNFNMEMEDSSGRNSKSTSSTSVKKHTLRQADSSRALLKTSSNTTAST